MFAWGISAKGEVWVSVCVGWSPLSMIWMHCGQVSFTSVACEVRSSKVQWKSPSAPASHPQFCKCNCMCSYLASFTGELMQGKNKSAKESGFVRRNFLITQDHCRQKNHSGTSFIPLWDAFEPGCIAPGLPRAPQFTLPDALDNVSVLNERWKQIPFQHRSGSWKYLKGRYWQLQMSWNGS